MSRTSHRPIALFYGEDVNKAVTESNYHVRSRSTSLVNAIRAAIRRIHVKGDAARVDVYDMINHPLATITAYQQGYVVSITDYAQRLHARELTTLGYVELY